jgi:hypothetical protein
MKKTQNKKKKPSANKQTNKQTIDIKLLHKFLNQFGFVYDTYVYFHFSGGAFVIPKEYGLLW